MIEYRRNMVREYTVKGYNQRQIAAVLKVSVGIVNKDLQYFRNEAKNNITKYIDEYLPAEYSYCLDGLNNILTQAWNMSLDEQSDNRQRIAALSLAKDCYAMKLDLLSSSTVVDRAVKFLDRHRGLTSQNEELLIEDDPTEWMVTVR